jgi:hypothetical protein
MAVGECSNPFLLKFTIYPCFSLMNLDELAFISLTKSDKALFGFKPIKYEHGLAFH